VLILHPILSPLRLCRPGGRSSCPCLSSVPGWSGYITARADSQSQAMFVAYNSDSVQRIIWHLAVINISWKSFLKQAAVPLFGLTYLEAYHKLAVLVPASAALWQFTVHKRQRSRDWGIMSQSNYVMFCEVAPAIRRTCCLHL